MSNLRNRIAKLERQETETNAMPGEFWVLLAGGMAPEDVDPAIHQRIMDYPAIKDFSARVFEMPKDDDEIERRIVCPPGEEWWMENNSNE